METKIIDSEKEWLDFFQESLHTKNIELNNVKFQGWPKLEIIIEGSRYHGTLPAELMRGFVGFQDDFYRSYAELRYKDKSLQRLTNEDKERLEFVFKIEDNCTKGTADESDQLNVVVEFLDKIFANMSGEEKLIGLAVLVFSYAGYKLYEKFSDTKSKAKELDAGTDALRLQKEAVCEAIAASGKIPQVAENFRKNSEIAFRSLFTGSHDASSISIGDRAWNSEEISEIIQKPEKDKEKKELTLSLYIKGIQKNRGYLTLSVIDNDDKIFPLKVEAIFADSDEIKLIFDAFERDREIDITFTAKIVDGEIKAGNFIELRKNTE